MTNSSNASISGFQSLVSSLAHQNSFQSLKKKLKSREKTLKQLRSTSQVNWSVTSLKASHSSVRSQHSSRKRSPVKKFLTKMRGFSKKKKKSPSATRPKPKTPRGLTSLKMNSKSPMARNIMKAPYWANQTTAMSPMSMVNMFQGKTEKSPMTMRNLYTKSN